MVSDTPHGWLERFAVSTPGEPALYSDAGVVSYGRLQELVFSRAKALRRIVVEGAIEPVAVRPDVVSIVELLAIMRAGAVPLPYSDTSPTPPGHRLDEVAICVSTSGSTRAPRLVPLSYRNISAAVAASRERLGTGPSDRWLATLPLDHVGGLSILWRSLEAGGSAVVAPFGRSVVGVIERSRPTIASLVPTMVHRLLDWSPDVLVSVGPVLVGGAGTSGVLATRARDLGVTLVPTYGMTEASSQVATAIVGSNPASSLLIGPPLSGFKVTVIGESGEAPAGQPGAIEIDGPAVFSGYVGRPPRDGAFKTSDIGFLTPGGELGIVGRADDVVLVGGLNVSLRAIRETTVSASGVLDVAVVGIPDPEWGAIPCVMVEMETTRTLQDIQEEVLDNLPRGHAPHRWLLAPIPLLPNGKHNLSAVRARFVEG
ncbi:MAG: class I adenylate-forming enzyme family protein [Acidimicrobiia bacterium]